MAKEKLSTFKNNVTSGFARSNLFEVTLGTNTNLTTSTLPTNASFLIKSASLPSSNIGTIAIPYQGRVFNVPGDRTFDSWSTTIINTEAFETRKFIESWINDIQRKDLNFSMAGNLDYTATLTVTAFKRDGAGKDTLDMVLESISSIMLSHLHCLQSILTLLQMTRLKNLHVSGNIVTGLY